MPSQNSDGNGRKNLDDMILDYLKQPACTWVSLSFTCCNLGELCLIIVVNLFTAVQDNRGYTLMKLPSSWRFQRTSLSNSSFFLSPYNLHLYTYTCCWFLRFGCLYTGVLFSHWKVMVLYTQQSTSITSSMSSFDQ